jgi:hypothetical protein
LGNLWSTTANIISQVAVQEKVVGDQVPKMPLLQKGNLWHAHVGSLEGWQKSVGSEKLPN